MIFFPWLSRWNHSYFFFLKMNLLCWKKTIIFKFLLKMDSFIILKIIFSFLLKNFHFMNMNILWWKQTYYCCCCCCCLRLNRSYFFLKMKSFSFFSWRGIFFPGNKHFFLFPRMKSFILFLSGQIFLAHVYRKHERKYFIVLWYILSQFVNISISKLLSKYYR